MLSELTALIILIIWTFPFKNKNKNYVDITFIQLGTRLPSPHKSNPSITNTLDQYPYAAHQNRMVRDILENDSLSQKKIKILLKLSTNCYISYCQT